MLTYQSEAAFIVPTSNNITYQQEKYRNDYQRSPLSCGRTYRVCCAVLAQQMGVKGVSVMTLGGPILSLLILGILGLLGYLGIRDEERNP